MKYDLEERTAKFGETVIDFVRKIKKDEVSSPIINQLVRSATSIGANYCEANQASSKKDFRNKIFISKKEVSETMYWLRMMARADEGLRNDCLELWKEAKSLTLIFSKIISSLKVKLIEN